jgi:hypothetical protein
MFLHQHMSETDGQDQGGIMAIKPRSARCLGIACFVVLLSFFMAWAEAEFKDTPYFSGMPNHRIGDATDQEFADHRFFNGKNCTTVEGKKYFRTYTLKENAKQSSDLQISRNYANAVRNMGGTVIFDGECAGAECAENCGGRMMTGKVIKGGNELWVEVVPFNEGNDYYLTLVLKEEMKQDITASGMLEALNRDGRIALYINFGFVTSLRDFLSSWFFGLFDQRSLSALRLQEPSF